MNTLKDCEDLSCLKSGQNLRVTCIPIALYCYEIYDKETATVNMKGLVVEKYLPFLLSSLNITYELIPPEEGEYGVLYENGSWSGNMGMLQRHEVDMNLGLHPLDFERFGFFNPSMPFEIFPLTFIGSVGKREVYDFFGFIYKMEAQVWFYLLLSFTLLVIFSGICDALELNVRNQQTTSSITRVKESMYRAIWVFLAALFCEGSIRTMSSRRGQFLQFSWLFCVLVIMTGLTGQLKAVLVIQRDEDVPRTLEQLANRPDILPMMTKAPLTQGFFKASELEKFKRIYQNALRRPMEAFTEIEASFSPDTYQLIKDGGYMLVTVQSICKLILAGACPLLTGDRRFYFMDDTFYIAIVTHLFNWDFPRFLKEQIDIKILGTREWGFMDHWNAELHKGYEKCHPVVKSSDETMTFNHMRQAFILLGVCQCICFAVFLVECIHKACVKYHKSE